MKKMLLTMSLLFVILLGGFTNRNMDDIELVCMKKQMAPNVCHYNFKLSGGKYRYVDNGCRFSKRNEVIRKVKEGSLGLAREWKVACQ